MSGVTTGPSPKPTLRDYAALLIWCDDCGNQKRMGPDTLTAYADRGLVCDEDLKPKLYCSQCRQRGSNGRNLSLMPTFRLR